jgi:SAM-dependent methyltransferase
LTGEVLDLCSSWISHFSTPPRHLVALGMNATELAANDAAAEWLVHDLNADPSLPFADASFDAVTCCVSVDYLTRPLEVFAEVARVLRPGGSFVCTLSNQHCQSGNVAVWSSSCSSTRVRTRRLVPRRGCGSPSGRPVRSRRSGATATS